jgi:hypothetical protein
MPARRRARGPAAKWTRYYVTDPYGVFKFRRCLSLLESNLDSVAKLLPMAESANDSFEFGTALGMMR